MALGARKLTSSTNGTGMITSSALSSMSSSSSTGEELGTRVVDFAILLGTIWGSGKLGIKSTLHGVFCVSSCLPAKGIVIPRIWAGKDYVDPKRIGIWGWVRASAP